MSLLLFADNASSLLASGISPTATTLTVTASTGALFSAPGAGQYALGTLEDVSGNVEVVQITSRTGDSFVVVRGQENTTAISFASGTVFEQRITAGMLAAFLQKQGGDTMSGTTTLSGVLTLGSGGSIRLGEVAGTPIRSQPGDTSNQIVVPIGSPATAAGSVILTTSNIAANVPSGYDFVHTGMVVLWTGSSGSVPAGWVICDGTNGTPNLRDQFVLGGGGALPTSGGSASTTTGATDPSGSLTVAGYALLATDLPQHTHQFGTGSGGTYVAGGSGSGFSLNLSGSISYVTNYPSGQPVGGNPIIQPAYGGSSPPAANAHTHNLSGSLTHTHSYLLPPYVALFYIMKQ